MAHVTHDQLLARMAAVKAAHAELHPHAHRLAGLPASSAPVVQSPPAGAAPKKGN